MTAPRPAMVARWEDPAFRAKQAAGRANAWQRPYSEAYREQQRQSSRRYWDDPANRAKAAERARSRAGEARR